MIAGPALGSVPESHPGLGITILVPSLIGFVFGGDFLLGGILGVIGGILAIRFEPDDDLDEFSGPYAPRPTPRGWAPPPTPSGGPNPPASRKAPVGTGSPPPGVAVATAPCPHGGSPVPGNAARCPSCGNPVRRTA